MANTAKTMDTETSSNVTIVQTLYTQEERPSDNWAGKQQGDTGHQQGTSPSKCASEDRTWRREIQLYVKENFKNRQCKKYVARTKKTERDRCQCGRGPDWHRNEEVDVTFRSSKETWESEKHTTPIVATSFGEICFDRFGVGCSENHVPYIRVDSEQDPGTCWTLLKKHWKMRPPKLIISVIGDANYFSREQLKKGFQRSLIKAATTETAWIITDGLATELGRSVGEAVRDHMLTTSSSRQTIVALGIAPWGCVLNKESLVAESENGLFPACYHVDDLTRNKHSSGAPIALDHNHTHFLLVDDGTEGNLGMELKFRKAFEKFIPETSITKLKAGKNRRERERMTTAGKPVAVVYLVLEGGKSTMDAAREALKNKIPVTVVQGSGGVADLIAECSRNLSRGLSEENVMKRFLNGAKSLFSSSSSDEKDIRDGLSELLKYKHLVSVVSFDDLHTNEEIDQAILNAIRKAQKCLLELTPENKTHPEIFEALVQNQVKMIGHGVDLKKFLTAKRLQDLYAQVLSDKSPLTGAGLLRNLLHRRQKWKGDYFNCFNENRNRELLLSAVDEVVNNWLLHQHHHLYKGRKFTHQKPKCKNQEPVFKHPETHLLIWSVLLNRKDLALLFWEDSKDLIGSALVASDLFQSMSERADEEGMTDVVSELRERSKEFQDKAVGILKECNQRDEIMTQKLLVRDLDIWDNTNVLAIAGWARMEEFMEQAACQTKLNKIWRGKMAVYTSWWKIALAVFCPFFIPIIEFKKGDEHQEDSEFVDAKSDEDQGNSCSPRKLHYFFTAPMVKFWYHVISQVIFLGLFSCFVLTDLRPASEPDSPGPVEITVLSWAATIVAEEMRQALFQINQPGASFPRWLQSFSFKRFVVYMVIFVMFVISMALRLTTDGSTFVWARRFYCLTLFVYYLTCLPFFFVAENTGPKVIMISKMLKDMIFFLFIFLVFTLAYGVALQGLRFPNSDLDWSLIKDVVYLPYWHLYGELFLDQLEGDDCSRNKTALKLNNHLVRCPEDSSLPFVLLAVYMVLTNIILLNLLIAVFTHTFEKVQLKSQKVWRFYRYELIREYFERPALPPPLISFIHLWRIFKYIRNRMSGYSEDEDKHDCFHQDFEKDFDKKLTEFERHGLKHHQYGEHIRSRKTVDAKVTTVGKSIRKVTDDLDFIKEHRSFDSSGEMSDSRGDTRLLTFSSRCMAEQLAEQQRQLSLQQQQLDLQQRQLQSIVKPT